MRSATGSRVSTSTGRSPPGVAANQISPRCIVPVRPILRGTPIVDLGERRLRLSRRRALPFQGVILSAQLDQMAMDGLSQDLGAIHAQGPCPALDLGGL